MAVRIIGSLLARKDLKEASAYIRKANSVAAKSFLLSISKKVDLLADFSEMGRVVPEQEEPFVREVIHHNYRIVYDYTAATNVVEITRIWHAARGEPEF